MWISITKLVYRFFYRLWFKSICLLFIFSFFIYTMMNSQFNFISRHKAFINNIWLFRLLAIFLLLLLCYESYCRFLQLFCVFVFVNEWNCMNCLLVEGKQILGRQPNYGKGENKTEKKGKHNPRCTTTNTTFHLFHYTSGEILIEKVVLLLFSLIWMTQNHFYWFW